MKVLVTGLERFAAFLPAAAAGVGAAGRKRVLAEQYRHRIESMLGKAR